MAGKPLPPMHRETILRTGAERPLVVGDRLDTDIEGAFNGGVDSLLVLTGVTDGAQLLAAPPAAPADVCGRRSARDADRAAGGGRGGRRVRVRRLDGVRAATSELALDGEGEALDGLRALCAAAWTRPGRASCALDAGKALARLGL